MPQQMEGILNLPDYEVLSSEGSNPVIITARYVGPVQCPDCGRSRVACVKFSKM